MMTKKITQHSFGKILTICLFGLLLVGTVYAQAPQYAYFGVTYTNGNHYFRDLSSAPGSVTATGWAWDFGDGSTSNVANPEHTYSTFGVHTVQLTTTFSDASTAAWSLQIHDDNSDQAHSDHLTVHKNATSVPINVNRNDNASLVGATFSIITAPAHGTATIDNQGLVYYTPNNNYIGSDFLVYHYTDGTIADSAFVFYTVDGNPNASEMDISPYFKGCGASRACTASGTWKFENQPSPNGSGCFGYQFSFRNNSIQTIDQMVASIDIDPAMTLDPNSGVVLKESSHYIPTSVSVEVEMDASNNRIILNLATGDQILEGEGFDFAFNVSVDSLPHGGAGSDYVTSLSGTTVTSAGDSRTFYEESVDREGLKCKDQNLVVSPAGCGVWGDIDTTRKSLTYTISFNNTTNATANEIRVRDMLPSALDYRTIRVIDAHPFAPEVQLNGTQEVNFYFHDAHLTTAASDSLGSEGHVTFTVDFKPSLPAGTPIDNWADIFFDGGLPLRSDTTFNTLFSAPSPRVDLGPDQVNIECDSCVTLTPTVVGGSGNNSFFWTDGTTDTTATVCPSDSTWIGLWVTDASTGCRDYSRTNFDVDCNLVSLDPQADAQAGIEVYPNPFQSTTHFRIKVKQSESMGLEIYDAMGVKVAELYRGPVTAGQVIDLNFDASNLAAGIYYYNLMHKDGLSQRGRLSLTK